MTILITGGTGFIGLTLAEALLRRGESVLLFGIDPPPVEAQVLTQLGGRVTALPGDVRDASVMDGLFREFDVTQVIHAAALSGNAGLERRDPRGVMDNNLIGALTVLDAAQRSPCRRFVLLSSAAVFGAAAYMSHALPEDLPPQPDTLYAIADHAAERSALRLKRLSGLDVVVLRLAHVFGRWERPRDGASPQLQSLMCARAGQPIRLPRPGLSDWLYTGDLADAVLAVLDAPRPQHGLYHLAGAGRWSVEDWCLRLSRRYPGLSFGLTGEPADVSVELPGPGDRAALSTRRFADEFGFHPRFDLDAAFHDFMSWHDR